MTARPSGWTSRTWSANLSPETEPYRELIEFTEAGVVVRSVSSSSARGIYELGNGNWLATNSSGVHIYDPAAATLVTTVATGNGYRFIELVVLP